jgi:uncharacterized protein YegP (UPF0339 family)
MNFCIYKDAVGDWRWFLYVIANSKKLADSGEGYRNKADCLYAIGLIRGGAGSAGIVEI